ncbi:uncharacterized protein LOC111087898 [Limulus polyphemus]|uniref:Uncharacterized protein LOC111087898 n=1 Tax=Limulus polyphemus TaxID=6850 RepID=A0ABM1T7T3_LIMPO|nr:uncharacterized protein LOC111087898 [Limulus polyphemus]
MKIQQHELFLLLSLSLNSKTSRNLSRKEEKVKIEEHERIFFVSLRYQRRTSWKQLTKYPTVDERTELSRDVLQKAISNIEKQLQKMNANRKIRYFSTTQKTLFLCHHLSSFVSS